MQHELKDLAGCDTKVDVKRFESVSELISFAESLLNSPDLKQRETANSKFYVSDLKKEKLGVDRVVTTADAVRAANGHWQAGLDRLDKLTAKLNAGVSVKPQKVRKRHRFVEDDGDDVCLDRLRNGQDFWSSMQKEKRRGPQRVTIISALDADAGKGSDEIFWRGAASVALCDVLEAAGYCVEIIGAENGKNTYLREKSGNREGLVYGGLNILPIKHHADPLNRSALINAFSGWFYRSFVFAMMTKNSFNGAVVASGLGGCKKLGPGELGEISSGDENVIVVQDVWSERQAVALVNDTIEKINNGKLAAVAT